MSYVHLRNALFLQPLPELSSVQSSQQQQQQQQQDPGGKAGLSGIFTSATVPQSLVANPSPGEQGTPGRSPADASAGKRAAGGAAGDAGTAAMARELEPVTLQGDTEEVRGRCSIVAG